MSVEEIVSALRSEGLALVPGVFTSDECADITARLEAVLKQREAAGIFVGNARYQVLYNYFMEDRTLLPMLAPDLVDQVMRLMIDDDYVLISPSARNRQLRNDMNVDSPTSGVGWHVDTRRIGGPEPAVLRPSPIYFAILALDDLGPANGATHYVPASHLRYQRPMDRDATPDGSRILEASAGSLIFMDSALWHKVGEASPSRRWMLFTMYGPWFMKPYFDFTSMFTADEAQVLSPRLRQALHFDSHPPRDHREGTITLRRVREAVGS